MFGSLVIALGQAAATSFISDEVLSKWMQLGLNVLAQGVNGESKMRALTAHVKMMAADGREPTKEEFDELRDQDEADDARIEAAAADRGL